MSDHVDTFVDAALDFTDRHRDDLNGTGLTFGGLMMGAMKAVAECPTCPDTFRTPYNAERQLAWPVGTGEWAYLRCPKCLGVWVLQDEPAATVPTAKKGRKR